MKFQVRWFESLDSTNRYLLDEARRGAASGLVAVADEQTAGRGRRGRTWIAPPGASLLVSVLVRIDLAPDRSRSVLTMASGLALAEAVERVAGFAPDLKWPNDLVVRERKLAGVLAESDEGACVIGTGLNVTWDEFPPELEGLATACNLEAGRHVDRREVLDAYLERLAVRLDDLDAVFGAYHQRLATLGRFVRVEQPEGELVGRAVEVALSGELLVELDDGSVIPVHAGDVVHLRDAELPRQGS